MKREAFEIIKIQKENSRRWHIGGRAYSDISLGDSLVTSSSPSHGLRVVGIVTYGKSTGLLSTMMTGTLTLEGDFYIDKGKEMFLYIE